MSYSGGLGGRFLSLLDKDFEDAGVTGLFTTLANQSVLGTLFMGQLDDSLALDLRAVKTAASAGLVPKDYIEFTEDNVQASLGSAYFDAATSVLPFKAQLGSELLLRFGISDAEAGPARGLRAGRRAAEAFAKSTKALARFNDSIKALGGDYFEKLGPLSRGWAVEMDLLRHHFGVRVKVGNTPVIDVAIKGAKGYDVTSIKSIDLDTLRATDEDTFRRVIDDYLAKMRDYKGGIVNRYDLDTGKQLNSVQVNKVASRNLLIALSGDANKMQARILEQARQRAAGWSRYVNLQFVK